MISQDRTLSTNPHFALNRRRGGRASLLAVCLAAVGSISVATYAATMIDLAQAGTRTQYVGTATAGVTILAKSDKPMRRGGMHPGPAPREAITACEDRVGAATCSFRDPHRNRTVDGACRRVPEGFSACVPNDAPPPPS